MASFQVRVLHSSDFGQVPATVAAFEADEAVFSGAATIEVWCRERRICRSEVADLASEHTDPADLNDGTSDDIRLLLEVVNELQLRVERAEVKATVAAERSAALLAQLVKLESNTRQPALRGFQDLVGTSSSDLGRR